LELDKVNQDLAEQELTLEATDEAVARLAEEGFDPQFGARPVKRVIQREVQDRLADLILSGDLRAGNTVLLDADDDGYRLTVSGALEAAGS
jgi:ATP-dependent Clp protease ATP-binding subunit ClpA